MSFLVGLDLDCSDVTDAVNAFESDSANGDEYVKCKRCEHGGCDFRMVGCGCTLHARCVPYSKNGTLDLCPTCGSDTSGLVLFPMNFTEVDEARTAAVTLAKLTGECHRTNGTFGTTSNGHGSGRRRKNSIRDVVSSSIMATSTSFFGRQRTGRWTPEEVVYADALIKIFDNGQLPMVAGTKLHDFLGAMLRSKPSRLSKKMKRTRLGSRTYKPKSGYVESIEDARNLSELEEDFFRSLADTSNDPSEAAVVKFFVRKEWRERAAEFCASTLQQRVDADSWWTSVEELDRRTSTALESVRVARRQEMVASALRSDLQNCDNGVFIKRCEGDLLGGSPCPSKGGFGVGSDGNLVVEGRNHNDNVNNNSGVTIIDPYDDISTAGEDEFWTDLLADTPSSSSNLKRLQSSDRLSSSTHSTDSLSSGDRSLGILHSQRRRMASATTSSFLYKVISYAHRHGVPFEHVDCWAPSVLPDSGTQTRLCYAGGVSLDAVLDSSEFSIEQSFMYSAFSYYSEKFSFEPGCGLPGKVYASGVPSWQQNVHLAPLHHFERRGGAQEWGIRTVMGIPIPSPSVGHMVVCFYSREDQPEDRELVSRVCTELTRLIPTPKWKLVVDLGEDVIPNLDFMKGQKNEVEIDVDQPVDSSGRRRKIEETSRGEYQSSGEPLSKKAKSDEQQQIDEVVALLGQHMPTDPNSNFLSGFMSLRLMLLKPQWDEQEKELLSTLMGSYTSYVATGRKGSDVANLLARDCIFLQEQFSNKNRAQPFPVLSQSMPSPQLQSLLPQSKLQPDLQVPLQPSTEETPSLSLHSIHHGRSTSASSTVSPLPEGSNVGVNAPALICDTLPIVSP